VSASAASSASAIAGRIGPNAITRVAEALAGRVAPQAVRHLFEMAGIADYLDRPPERMVPEDDVARLYSCLFAELGEASAGEVVRRAGLLTGDYLLARRIPLLAQRVLRCLPRNVAARLLLAAIGRHAWTFAGSGAFDWRFAPGLELRISDSVLCRRLRTHEPACGFYAATFERLFARLVDAQVRVVETQCVASGAADCRFAVIWS
jgi:divinyl protochlorophyllide a 8-vinyl-reductase